MPTSGGGAGSGRAGGALVVKMLVETESPKRVIRRVPSKAAARPTVGVVTPAYNYARYLRECVDSVLAQRDVDVHALIIDDCSSDDTPALCRELAADPRVTFIRHERNRGHIASVNERLGAGDGEDIVKLH